jgi:hypothetical protein
MPTESQGRWGQSHIGALACSRTAPTGGMVWPIKASSFSRSPSATAPRLISGPKYPVARNGQPQGSWAGRTYRSWTCHLLGAGRGGHRCRRSPIILGSFFPGHRLWFRWCSIVVVTTVVGVRLGLMYPILPSRCSGPIKSISDASKGLSSKPACHSPLDFPSSGVRRPVRCAGRWHPLCGTNRCAWQCSTN